MDIDDVEFINNLYIELKTFLEHLEIDRLLDDLNIKLQPIVFFENKTIIKVGLKFSSRLLLH